MVEEPATQDIHAPLNRPVTQNLIYKHPLCQTHEAYFQSLYRKKFILGALKLRDFQRGCRNPGNHALFRI